MIPNEVGFYSNTHKKIVKMIVTNNPGKKGQHYQTNRIWNNKYQKRGEIRLCQSHLVGWLNMVMLVSRAQLGTQM